MSRLYIKRHTTKKAKILGKISFVVYHLSNMPDMHYCLTVSHINKTTKPLTFLWLSVKYFQHAISHGVMTLKEVTGGLLQLNFCL